MIDLSKSVVTKNGLVDLESTLVAVRDAVVAWNETQAADLESVGTAVHAVFDTYKGSFINSKALGSFVSGILKPTSLEAMSAVGERTNDYVKANSGEGGAFRIVKAKGVCRVADQVAPATK
jgi:hypothetical protein